MKYRTMEEPPRVAKLPHYKGIPVPYTTLVLEDGTPNFKAIDDEKVWEVKRDGKCSVCGEPLDYWIAFMVEDKEIESRMVFDNPNHEDCLRYAFNVCPWLYYSKAKYSDIHKLNANDKLGIVYIENNPNRNQESLTRPKNLAIYVTNNYKNVIHERKYRVCKVGKAKRIEWIEGQ